MSVRENQTTCRLRKLRRSTYFLYKVLKLTIQHFSKTLISARALIINLTITQLLPPKDKPT
ncbi:MAG: hypothetical protein ACTS44_00655 [Candidatus Hodgkinia cicadicola]